MNYSRLINSAGLIISAAVSLLVGLELIAVSFDLPPTLYSLLYLIILGGLFGLLALHPWAMYRHSDTITLCKAFILGAVVGLVLAVVKIFLYRELWTVFNILAEPLRNGLIGTLIINLTLRMRSTAAYV